MHWSAECQDPREDGALLEKKEELSHGSQGCSKQKVLLQRKDCNRQVTI